LSTKTLAICLQDILTSSRLFSFFVVVLAAGFIPAAFCADTNPGFEQQDLYGSTVNYSSTVGTSEVNIPSSPNKVISEIFFKCPSQTPATIKCFISFDGTTFMTILPGESLGWSVKGLKKQIKIKGNQAGVLYEAVINYEEY
jgi:hypothetical protein